MKLYKLWQTDFTCANTFAEMIVCADDLKEAINIHPNTHHLTTVVECFNPKTKKTFSTILYPKTYNGNPTKEDILKESEDCWRYDDNWARHKTTVKSLYLGKADKNIKFGVISFVYREVDDEVVEFEP